MPHNRTPPALLLGDNSVPFAAEIEPGDDNARKYLATIRQRVLPALLPARSGRLSHGGSSSLGGSPAAAVGGAVVGKRDANSSSSAAGIRGREVSTAHAASQAAAPQAALKGDPPAPMAPAAYSNGARDGARDGAGKWQI